MLFFITGTPDTTIAAMIADEAAIGVINQKTTAVRIIPYGRKVTCWNLEVFLGMPVMKVNKASSADFIARGGQISSLFTALKS